MHCKMALVGVATVASLVGCDGAATMAGTTSVPNGAGGAGTPNAGGGTTSGGVPDGGTGSVGGGSAPDGGTPDGGGSGSDGGPSISPCSTTPAIVATDIVPLATDGAYIYGWGTQRIARVPVGGGTTQTILGAVDTTADFSLLVDDTQIYWVWQDWQQNRNVLLRAPKSGGSATVVADINGLSIVSDATSLYDSEPGFTREPKHGGAPTPLNSAVPGALAVDAGYAYWISDSDSSGTQTLQRAPLTSGAAESIATWQGYAENEPASVVDGLTRYVLDSQQIWREDLRTGSVTSIFDWTAHPDVGGGDRIDAMSVDADSVYLVLTDDDETGPRIPNPNHWVIRVGKDGSNPRNVASDQGLGHHALGVGDSVYFDTDGALYRVCK